MQKYHVHLLVGAALTLLASIAHAGQTVTSSKETTEIIPVSPWKFSSELTLSSSYTSPSRIDGRDVSAFEASGQYVLTTQYNEGVPFRIGASWERLSFSSTAMTRVPNTLQSESIVVGFDFQLGQSVFMRVEAQPGLYAASSRIDGDAFDIPIVVGGSYVYSKDVQLILGVSIDPQRQYPVLPGGGIRWQINDKWLLNAVLPKPRLEYAINKDFSVYAGGEIIDGTYRVSDDFGPTGGGHSTYDSTWVCYVEGRVGAGATLKVGSVFEFNVEGGYVAYRNFNFTQDDSNVQNNGGGIYAGLTLTAKF